MRVEPTDRHIALWAERIAAPCYYVSEPNMPTPCLKVQCGHLTAYFRRGRLIRLWACADSTELDDMFKQLSLLFRHCGTGLRGISRNADTDASAPKPKTIPKTAPRPAPRQ